LRAAQARPAGRLGQPERDPDLPPIGVALAAVMLLGPRVWPAIFVPAFAANITTAGTLVTALLIALGNTL